MKNHILNGWSLWIENAYYFWYFSFFFQVTSRFPVSIVKFDVAYPYGPKQDAYTKMAEAARSLPDILVAEVGVKDYGDKDNSDLAERFNIPKDKFPVVKLFVQGS